MARLGPVRCWCGRELQSALGAYDELRAGGLSIKEALDGCGLPRGCPFTSEEDQRVAPTPPPSCCRGLLMCNIDQYDSHSLFQAAVAHGEGAEAVGARQPQAPASAAAPPAVALTVTPGRGAAPASLALPAPTPAPPAAGLLPPPARTLPAGPAPALARP